MNFANRRRNRFRKLRTRDALHESRFIIQNYVYSREKRILLIIREIACKTT